MSVNIEAIIAVDEDYGLAKNGKIPWKNREDMKFFKQKTIGNIVVMGSKTLLSFPNQAPLGNRYNIVLTNNKQEFIEKYSSYNNIGFYNYEELMNYINNIETDRTIYIIGGKQVYDLLLPKCSKIFLSIIYDTYDCDLKLELNLEKYKIIEQSANTFRLFCLTL
jgi:dihydrofolate reductase